jgi:crotonobetainyl-CoA:carnitine CoA-transferase CaiB-like acyl-CoA transferase
MKHILDGTRVLDFSHVLAGPTCTRLLVEMGAEVIKIELLPAGDITRVLPVMIDGRSGYYVQHNRGKKSVCLDHKDPRARAALKGLVKNSDILVENYSVGVIARMGLGWDVVHELNPKLVMCSISAFGQEGPMSHYPGYDYIAAAYTGVTSIIGTADGTPVLPMCAFGDVGTGVSAAGANGYALLHAERTGRGQYLDISLIDTYYQYQEVNVQALSISKGAFMPRPSGNQHYALMPLGIYKGKEKDILIIAVPHQWPWLCKAMGRDELIDDPRFADNTARCDNTAALVAIIEEWLQEQDSDDAAIRILQDARVPVAPVLTNQEAIELPHMVQRGTAQKISDSVLGEFVIPAIGYRFSKFPTLDLQAPFLGQHNTQVLIELAGLTVEQVAEMEADGTLVSEPIPEGAAASE